MACRRVLALALLAGCATAQSVSPEDAPGATDGADGAAPDAAFLEDTDAPKAPADSAPMPTDGPPADSAPEEVTAPPTDATRACPTGQRPCGELCVDVAVDPRHCGSCGRACATGERCELGLCRVTCPSGQEPCVGADGASACVTLATDRAHCGRCGGACAAGQVCASGRCMNLCAGAQTACPAAAGGVSCVDLTVDARHCGMCGAACPAGERCLRGACALACPEGQTGCDGRCVTVATDEAHCGRCGNACPSPQRCALGLCRAPCVAPQVDCAGVCRDLQRDAANCGLCARACAAGERCASGRCEPDCPAGFTACGSACRNLLGDASNCGACGRACAAGERCSSGRCGGACPTGQTSCGGSCAALATDPSHCGACGSVCPTRANGAPTCALGVCGVSCRPGFGDCDRNATNGCEADTDTSLAHCGACGTACGALAGARPQCVAGRCQPVCDAGRADCDAVANNGCEVDLQSSATNCGACRRACLTGQSCVLGSCAAAASVLEPFDAGVWVYAPWRAVSGASGTRQASCAHDGATGLQDPGWAYRTDVTIGSAGQRLSSWVRLGSSARFYLGFGASASRAWSLVAASNTSSLLFQSNVSYGYTDVGSRAMTWTAGRWYRLEVTFGVAGAVTGKVYDSDGRTELASLSATLAGFTPGGVAVRAFGATCIDTIERR